MATYDETIRRQMARLAPSIKWWPRYLYHFTDVHNAIGIIERGWIYGRKKAASSQLMESDNASSNVISFTSEEVQDYGRLYFRPKTPTQYNNEGYKPAHIRDVGLNASCPVPVFFVLDAIKTLQLDRIQFVEKGAANSQPSRFKSGEASFAELNFEKIFHDGPHEPGSDIKKYKSSEVLRYGGIPINGILRSIVCRSPAEKQTLLSLIREKCPAQYDEYKQKAYCDPKLDMFYMNGIYIKEVQGAEDRIQLRFNETQMRYHRDRAKEGGGDFQLSAICYWVNEDGATIGRTDFNGPVNYRNDSAINLLIGNRKSNQVRLEVYFDKILMYEGNCELSEYDVM